MERTGREIGSFVARTEAECQRLRDLIEERTKLGAAEDRRVEGKVDSTVQALRELIESRFAGVERESRQRVEAVECELQALRAEREAKTDAVAKEFAAKLDGHMKSHEREHVLITHAEGKQMELIEARLKASNAFREQMLADRNDFVRRDTLDDRFASMNALVSMVREDMDKQFEPMKAWQSNLQGRIAVWGVVALFISTLIVTLVSVLMNVMTGG